jgi:hypothetical protein
VGLTSRSPPVQRNRPKLVVTYKIQFVTNFLKFVTSALPNNRKFLNEGQVNARTGAVTHIFCYDLSKIQFCEMSLNILQDEEDDIIVPNSRLDIYVHLDIAHLFKMIRR